MQYVAVPKILNWIHTYDATTPSTIFKGKTASPSRSFELMISWSRTVKITTVPSWSTRARSTWKEKLSSSHSGSKVFFCTSVWCERWFRNIIDGASLKHKQNFFG